MQQKDLLRNIKSCNVSTVATTVTKLQAASGIHDAVNAVRNITPGSVKAPLFTAFNAKARMRHGTHNVQRELQRKID